VAYDEELAERVREALAPHKSVTEQKMFGGIAFMLAGNMCAGVHGEDLIVRLGPASEKALSEPHARPMTMGKMTAKGLVLVAPAGVGTDKALGSWLGRATAFAASLPAKEKKKKPPAKTKKR
jgi:TfoX/Sxy family transcriptional regulator of competence genes